MGIHIFFNKYIFSHLFRIPEIYEALKEVTKVQVEIADRERTNFTDALEKSSDVMIAILPLLIYLKIKRSATVVSLPTYHKPNTGV